MYLLKRGQPFFYSYALFLFVSINLWDKNNLKSLEFSFSALNLVCYEVNNVTITMNGGHTFSKSELGWHNRSLHLGKTVVICEGNMEVLHLYVCNLWSMAKSRKPDRFFNLCLLLDSVCCMPLCWIALVPCFYSYLPKPSGLPSLMVPLGFSFRHRWWHLAIYTHLTLKIFLPQFNS